MHFVIAQTDRLLYLEFSLALFSLNQVPGPYIISSSRKVTQLHLEAQVSHALRRSWFITHYLFMHIQEEIN